MRLNFLLPSLALMLPSVISTGLVEGYTVSEMEWTGEFQGKACNVSGTVQDVYAHFQSIDPTFVLPTAAPAEAPVLKENFSVAQSAAQCLVKTFGPAETNAISFGIVYLNTINSNIALGGYQCSRISCSYNSAIWWCNQIGNTFIQGSGWLGSHAQTLIEKCPVYNGAKASTCGQNFDAGGYNIIVRGDSC